MQFIFKTLCLVIILYSLGCSHPNPEAAYYHARLGLMYTQAGAYSYARVNAFKAVALDSHSALAHYAVAYYAQKTQQKDLAQQHYDFALKYQPDSGIIHLGYADYLCEEKNYSQAIAHFEKALQDTTYAAVSHIYQQAGTCALQIPNPSLAEYFFHQAHLHAPS